MDTKTILETVGVRDLLTFTWPTGKDVQQYLERIFNYAINKKYFHGNNPAAWSIIQDLVPDKTDVYERKHRDWLKYTDMYRFLQKLRAYKDRSVRQQGHPAIADALEVVALTGVRDDEVLAMQWKEIDGNTWNVPPEHRKGRKRTIRPIPITKTARAVLERRRAQRVDPSDDDELVFPSDRNGGKISVGSLARFLNENIKWDYKIVPHGFRSTLRDWRAAQTRYDDILWKRQVDHKSGFAPGAGNHLLPPQRDDATDQAYGHDPLLEPRRVMMEAYDRFANTPPTESNKVVKFSDKRRTA